MLVCRNCRISLAADNYGCAICNSMRKHITVIGEEEDDKPSLASTSNELVTTLRAALKKLREDIKSGEDPPRCETRLLALGNTMSKVLESARKLQDDGISAVEQMSFTEKAEMFVSWIASLPPGFRKNLREQWDSWELEEAQPQKSLANN